METNVDLSHSLKRSSVRIEYCLPLFKTAILGDTSRALIAVRQERREWY